MTVSNGKDGLRTFAGDDVTDTFPVTFGFDGAASLIVVLRGAADSLPAFTVNGTAAQQRAGAATITTGVVPATGETLIVTRATPAEQGSDYSDAAAFPTDDVEQRLDWLTRAIGDLQRTFDRALVGDWLDAAGTHQVPRAALRADRLLGFDADGALETLHAVSDLVGPAFGWDAQGDLADLGDHDAEAEGFAYLATDQAPPLLYIREGATAGVWSAGIAFIGAGDHTVIRVPASGVDAADPDALVVTTGLLPAAKTDGVKLRFTPGTNTGAVTLEARQDAGTSWGPEPLVDRADAALAAGALSAVPIEATWSATLDKWVLVGYLPSADLGPYAKLGEAQSFTGAQRGAVTTLTSTAGEIAIDLAANNYFDHDLTEDTVLANPSGGVAAQSGCIFFTQHAGAAKTLAYGTAWKPVGSAPSAPTDLGGKFRLDYVVRAGDHIEFTLSGVHG